MLEGLQGPDTQGHTMGESFPVAPIRNAATRSSFQPGVTRVLEYNSGSGHAVASPNITVRRPGT